MQHGAAEVENGLEPRRGAGGEAGFGAGEQGGGEGPQAVLVREIQTCGVRARLAVEIPGQGDARMTVGLSLDLRHRVLDDVARRGQEARDEAARRGQEARDEVTRRGLEAREDIDVVVIDGCDSPLGPSHRDEREQRLMDLLDVASLKAAIERNERDIDSLQRELARRPLALKTLKP